MNITLNGQGQEADAGCTVASLVEELGFADRPCAVEVNGELVTKSCHSERVLSEGDAVEIVTLVGGG